MRALLGINVLLALLDSDHVDHELARASNTEHHESWSCSVSLLGENIVDRSRLYGPREVNEAYLLTLATVHGGRFVTIDQSIPLSAVPGARKRT